jgi:hypothetical protein
MVELSCTETEYVGHSEASNEAIWLRTLFDKFRQKRQEQNQWEESNREQYYAHSRWKDNKDVDTHEKSQLLSADNQVEIPPKG